MRRITQASSEIREVIHIATTAAREAGQYLLQKLGNAKVEYQKSSRDDLLDADLEAEHMILTHLRKRTPELGIQSEEAGQEGRHDHYWIIDPLDGSANFQHGNPLFAIAIALVIDNITRGAVVYIPTGNEMFTAILNEGAYLNGSPIHVSTTSTIKDAIIHVGDFIKEDNTILTEYGLQDFTKLTTQARRIRMLGTAATDLAYIAAGRADALINHTTNSWDVEPGKLLLLEAGGKVTRFERTGSKPLSIYTNTHLHTSIENLLCESKQ